MALSSFCGLLTLQVGAGVLGAVFLTLAVLILVANLFDNIYDIESWPIPVILMIILVLLFIIAAGLMVASSYQESRGLALASLVVIVIVTCYWIILSCLSIISSATVVRAVCIFSRCPESFWLANLYYREEQEFETVDKIYSDASARKNENDSWWGAFETTTAIKEKKGKRAVTAPLNLENKIITLDPLTNPVDKQWGFTTLSTNETSKQNVSSVDKPPPDEHSAKLEYYTSQSPVMRLSELSKTNTSRGRIDKSLLSSSIPYYFLKSDGNDKEKKNTTEKTDEESSSGYIFGRTLIGTIILTVVNLIFLLYSAFVMWSLAQELDWSDYIVEDDPEVIYEDDY